ncbi:MAG: hypothetical protein AAF098_03405 [Pseudomonadota bacterium]
MKAALIRFGFLILSLPAVAGEADVLAVDTFCDDQRICRFSVTVRHDDEGWDHYADRWDVLTLDEVVLGTRVLAHPHEKEQPFTRSLRKVRIPQEVKAVIIRARDSVHGFGGLEVHVAIPD